MDGTHGPAPLAACPHCSSKHTLWGAKPPREGFLLPRPRSAEQRVSGDRGAGRSSSIPPITGVWQGVPGKVKPNPGCPLSPLPPGQGPAPSLPCYHPLPPEQDQA